MKSKISEYITIDELRELFEVRGSDVVRKTTTASGANLGDIAGCLAIYRSNTYRRVGYTCKNRKRHLMFAHHIAFALHHGRWATGLLDHRDSNGLNNDPKNLREATSQQNNINQKVRNTNLTGVKGVFYMPRYIKPYVAQVKVSGVKVFSENFASLKEATTAVQQARAKHHGEFVRHA